MGPTGLVIFLGFAIFFYRTAESENRSGILWSCASIFAFAVAVYFSAGWIGMILGQLVVFLAMWVANCLRRRLPDF